MKTYAGENTIAAFSSIVKGAIAQAGGGSSGGTPIGTVISFMGTTAPKDYLICDGATYGITAYPELASFFAAQFGASNHFGGDGTTTFAVPDLRNLFLRGYHGEAEEQLSGDVGAKQEGTKHLSIFTGTSNVTVYPNGNYFTRDADTLGEFVARRIANNDRIDDANTINTHYTSRPVNMAVLYCIKAISSASPVSLPENTYSTEETRIGTWTDGKPLYRKCYEGIMDLKVENSATILDSNFTDKSIVSAYGQTITTANYQYAIPYSQYFSGGIIAISFYKDPNGVLKIVHHYSGTISARFQVVVEYTKTTDIASEVISADQPIANTVSAEQDQAGQG